MVKRSLVSEAFLIYEAPAQYIAKETGVFP
jgi:hypothetical protein